MSLLAAFLPSLLGVVGSLFKGKKAQYSTNQNPQQAQAYQMLLNQLMQRMRSGQQSPVQQAGNQSMNQLSQMFYGTPFPQQQQTARPTLPPGFPSLQGPGQRTQQ